MIRYASLAMLMVFCLAILSGCNTVKGMGRDIQSGGRAIEKSSGE